MSEIGDKQRRFVWMAGQLIQFAYANGYALSFGCARCALPGHHIANSLHYKGLAIDLNLYRRDASGQWVYLKDTIDYKPLGEFWETIGGSWGGRFGESSPGAGATISRTAYAQLFSVIGTAFGAGDGSTTFRLPDLRGEFLRAWDDGRGVDSGRVFGSAQAQQTDNLRSIQTRVVGGQGYHDREIPSTGDFSSNTESGGESGTGIVVQARHWNRETRPRNIALLACIRY